jgi:hypothetical protein
MKPNSVDFLVQNPQRSSRFPQPRGICLVTRGCLHNNGLLGGFLDFNLLCWRSTVESFSIQKFSQQTILFFWTSFYSNRGTLKGWSSGSSFFKFSHNWHVSLFLKRPAVCVSFQAGPNAFIYAQFLGVFQMCRLFRIHQKSQFCYFILNYPEISLFLQFISLTEDSAVFLGNSHKIEFLNFSWPLEKRGPINELVLKLALRSSY